MQIEIREKKGITIVSLVVTIILLIILGGISINTILGDNGIITIAKKAKENMELAQIAEQTKLNELYVQIEKEEGTLENNYVDFLEKINEFKRRIAEYINEAGGIKPEYTANVETFGESILGIVKEVTKDATATVDDIGKGKTAWVNGEKIIGNGNNGLKILSVMYNHEISIETTTYVDQPANGEYWHSSVNGNKKEFKYGTKSESQTNLIPLYKIDENGKVYLLYSIDYYRNVSCTDHAGHFTGGLTVYLHDANGNEITSSSFGRCAVNQTHNNVKQTFQLFEYNINTDAVYISFMLRCGGRESSDGPAVWSAGIHNRLDLTYYTAKEE